MRTTTGLKRNPLPEESAWLRSDSTGSPLRVDRENGIIRGAILAEEGPFKSEGRGEFVHYSLERIVKLVAQTAPHGLKSRWRHPTLSDDGLGKFLGRFRNASLSDVIRNVGAAKTPKEVELVRADLHFNKTALEEPVGGGKPLGVYVMDLAESDPYAFGCSLVLNAHQIYREDDYGRRATDPITGEERPPIWIPSKLHACDVVDTGDATNAFLAPDELPDELVRRAVYLLDRQFPNSPDAVVRARVESWLNRYLSRRSSNSVRATESADDRHRREQWRWEKLRARHKDREIDRLIRQAGQA